MRIISQNGMDFPYDQIVVEVFGNTVSCRPVADMRGRYYTLGEYENQERAEEVFKNISFHYHTKPLMEDGNTLYCQETFVMPEE